MSDRPARIIVDTDIGSDIDDEFTLAMLWGSPEVDLLGISASYGDTVLRTRITRRMAELAGRELRVEPGDALTWSGREIWWAGHEGDAYGPLDAAVATAAEDQPSRGATLIAELARSAAGGDGRRPHLLAIGPLATVASALESDPELPDRLEHLWIMGGDFASGEVEHNIVSDIDAARRVFSSGVPTTLVPVDVTVRVRLYEADIARIEACGELGRILALQARAWMERWQEDYEIPHDPLTLLALLRPELFVLGPTGSVIVSDGSDDYPVGHTRHVAGTGQVRVVRDVDVAAASAEIADRIVRGLTAP